MDDNSGTRVYPTSTPSSAPPTPPPSLTASSRSATSARSYSRTLLLSLATPHSRPCKIPQRLAALDLLRKDSTSDWGIDESQSSILDGEPISLSFPVPKDPLPVPAAPTRAKPAEPDLVFLYQTPLSKPAPILIEFQNPDPFGRGKTGALVEHVAEELPTIRLGHQTRAFSRTPSLVSVALTRRSSRLSTLSDDQESSLNPFAAPWPLPRLDADPSPRRDSGSSSSSLPPALPSSLPPKPHGGLPPVFIKRESAALPQPMSNPQVEPLGPAWQGEASLSGNEKRRRASLVHSLGSSPATTTTTTTTRDQRPQHLVQLGRSLQDKRRASLRPCNVENSL